MEKKAITNQALQTGEEPMSLAPIALVSKGSQTQEKIGNCRTFLEINIPTSSKSIRGFRMQKTAASKEIKKRKSRINSK